MSTRRIGLAVVAAFAAVVLSLAPSASAQDDYITCSGTLPAGTYYFVSVANYETCITEPGVRIKAGIAIGLGSSFIMGSADKPELSGQINGLVFGGNYVSIQIHHALITHGITMFIDTTYAPPATTTSITDNVIQGRVYIDHVYSSDGLTVTRNVIDGNVRLTNNNAPTIEFSSNTITGNLRCEGNLPAPQLGSGSPNRVSGQKTGQCAAL